MKVNQVLIEKNSSSVVIFDNELTRISYLLTQHFELYIKHDMTVTSFIWKWLIFQWQLWAHERIFLKRWIVMIHQWWRLMKNWENFEKKNLGNLCILQIKNIIFRLFQGEFHWNFFVNMITDCDILQQMKERTPLVISRFSVFTVLVFKICLRLSAKNEW